MGFVVCLTLIYLNFYLKKLKILMRMTLLLSAQKHSNLHHFGARVLADFSRELPLIKMYRQSILLRFSIFIKATELIYFIIALLPA